MEIQSNGDCTFYPYDYTKVTQQPACSQNARKIFKKFSLKHLSSILFFFFFLYEKSSILFGLEILGTSHQHDTNTTHNNRVRVRLNRVWSIQANLNPNQLLFRSLLSQLEGWQVNLIQDKLSLESFGHGSLGPTYDPPHDFLLKIELKIFCTHLKYFLRIILYSLLSHYPIVRGITCLWLFFYFCFHGSNRSCWIINLWTKHIEFGSRWLTLLIFVSSSCWFKKKLNPNDLILNPTWLITRPLWPNWSKNAFFPQGEYI